MNEQKEELVFLSYASEDLELVKKIAAALETRGLKVWFDKKSMGLGGWRSQIRQAIGHSRYFVICLSAVALKKLDLGSQKFFNEELNYACHIACEQAPEAFTIVPLVIEPGCASLADHRLSRPQQIQLYDSPELKERDFERNLDTLAVQMGGRSLADAQAKDQRSAEQKLIESLHGKASLAFYAQEYEQAIKSLRYIVEVLDPEYANAYSNWGGSLVELGRYEEAIGRLQKAVELNPQDGGALFNISLIYSILKNAPEAISYLQKALAAGFEDHNKIKNSSAFDFIRDLPAFRELLP